MNEILNPSTIQRDCNLHPMRQESGTVDTPVVRLPEPSVFDACQAVSHNIGYINACYGAADASLKLPYRICIVGPGRSGKDTAAGILGDLLGYRGVGSTSYGVIPLVSYAMTGRTDIKAQTECYEIRHQNRKYWFDFCNLLRRIDPLLLLKLTLASTDFVVGTRSKEEFINSLDYFRPLNVLWISRRHISVDPTLEFDHAFVVQACNARGIRHTMVGNNDSLEVLKAHLKYALDSGILVDSSKCEK